MKAKFIGKFTPMYKNIIPGNIYNVKAYCGNAAITLFVKEIGDIIPYDSLQAMFDNWDFDVKDKKK